MTGSFKERDNRNHSQLAGFVRVKRFRPQRDPLGSYALQMALDLQSERIALFFGDPQRDIKPHHVLNRRLDGLFHLERRSRQPGRALWGDLRMDANRPGTVAAMENHGGFNLAGDRRSIAAATVMVPETEYRRSALESEAALQSRICLLVQAGFHQQRRTWVLGVLECKKPHQESLQPGAPIGPSTLFALALKFLSLGCRAMLPQAIASPPIQRCRNAASD
jgi:hypothetical protein